MISILKNKTEGNESELLAGITFVNSQIAQFDSLIFTLESQKKEFVRNKERMENELSELRERNRKLPPKR